jgi:hypothetical protein
MPGQDEDHTQSQLELDKERAGKLQDLSELDDEMAAYLNQAPGVVMGLKDDKEFNEFYGLTNHGETITHQSNEEPEIRFDTHKDEEKKPIKAELQTTLESQKPVDISKENFKQLKERLRGREDEFRNSLSPHDFIRVRATFDQDGTGFDPNTRRKVVSTAEEFLSNITASKLQPKSERVKVDRDDLEVGKDMNKAVANLELGTPQEIKKKAYVQYFKDVDKNVLKNGREEVFLEYLQKNVPEGKSKYHELNLVKQILIDDPKDFSLNALTNAYDLLKGFLTSHEAKKAFLTDYFKNKVDKDILDGREQMFLNFLEKNGWGSEEMLLVEDVLKAPDKYSFDELNIALHLLGEYMHAEKEMFKELNASLASPESISLKIIRDNIKGREGEFKEFLIQTAKRDVVGEKNFKIYNTILKNDGKFEDKVQVADAKKAALAFLSETPVQAQERRVKYGVRLSEEVEELSKKSDALLDPLLKKPNDNEI